MHASGWRGSVNERPTSQITRSGRPAPPPRSGPGKAVMAFAATGSRCRSRRDAPPLPVHGRGFRLGFRVIGIIRPKRARRRCGALHQVPAPRGPSPNLVTSGLPAHALVSRCCDHRQRDRLLLDTRPSARRLDPARRERGDVRPAGSAGPCATYLAAPARRAAGAAERQARDDTHRIVEPHRGRHRRRACRSAARVLPCGAGLPKRRAS